MPNVRVEGSAFAVVACRLRICQGAVTSARRPGIDVEVVVIDLEVLADGKCFGHTKLGINVGLFKCQGKGSRRTLGYLLVVQL